MMTYPMNFSQSDFDKAYRIAAHLVAKHGEKYLPIFKRLNDEKARIQASQSLTDLALQYLAQEV